MTDEDTRPSTGEAMTATDMQEKLRDGWGEFVAPDDTEGQAAMRSLASSLTDLAAEGFIVDNVRHDDRLRVRRLNVSSPGGDFAGGLVISDEMVERRGWDAVSHQANTLAAELRARAS